MLCHNGGGPVRREYSPEQTVFAAVQPTMMAAFLYLGAGAGLFLCGILSRENKKSKPLTKAELPYTLGMIVLDIAAPILLMMGLERTNSANASLLNNFEDVATSLIAFFVFKEAVCSLTRVRCWCWGLPAVGVWRITAPGCSAPNLLFRSLPLRAFFQALAVWP